MKNLKSKIIGGVLGLALLVMLPMTCTGVDSGHKGVEVGFGGKTNMNVVYDEGINWGLHWIWDDMVEYDVREHTMVREFSFNDKNDMLTTVTVALDYTLSPKEINSLHVGINDVKVKIETSLSSAAKEVVPQYGAVDLNKHARAEGESKLSEILRAELPEFYVMFKRVRFTDINIPAGISKLAEETAVQIGKNDLATKMEAEQKSLAKAKVAKAQGNYDAGLLDAKTKKLLSQPELLKLQQLEVDMEWAKQGKSKYGNNNMFGIDAAAVLKSIK